MKLYITLLLSLGLLAGFDHKTFAQNVGIGALTPVAKLHIKGTADVSQLIVEANSTQSNTNPIIKLRKSDGTDLMWIHSDNPFNTFIGLNAGRLNDGGEWNTFIGRDAGYSNSSGINNTAEGIGTLFSNTTGSQNAAFGGHALNENTIGYKNVAVGAYALKYNTSAGENIAMGFNALGGQNYNPGFVWPSGNVAVGYLALSENQPTSTSNGIYNTAVGYKAMEFNTTGFENTGMGFKVLDNNTIGKYNTAMGSASLLSNTVGISNTALGAYALFGNTTASENTAVGVNALRVQSYNGIETRNVAIGTNALYFNQPTSQANGVNNTAVGHSALYANNVGYNNTAIGTGTLVNLIGGADNLAIGSGAGTDVGSPNINNTISIGNAGALNAASNQALIGNFSTTWNGGHVTWSTFSDARIKTNIQEDVVGLNFINRLRPVTYYKSIEAMRAITGDKETTAYPEKYDIEKIKTTGFLAQEVEQSAVAAGYDFSGVTIPKKSNELYTLSYEQFVVPLVKAVQELSAKNNAQDIIIENIKAENASLVARIEKVEKLLEVKK